MTIIYKYTEYMKKKTNDYRNQNMHIIENEWKKKQKYFYECERQIDQIGSQNSQNTHEFQNNNERNWSNTQLSIDKFRMKNFDKYWNYD